MSLRQQLLEFFDQEIINHYSADELLRHLIEFLPILFNFDRGCVVLQNENNDFSFFYGHNCPKEYERAILLDKHKLLLKSYAQSDLIISTNNQQAFFYDIDKFVFCDVALFPLLKGKEVVGFIILENEQSQADILENFEEVYGYISARISAFLENTDIQTNVKNYVEEKDLDLKKDDLCLSGDSLAHQSVIGLAFLDNKNFLWENIAKSFVQNSEKELEQFRSILAEAIKQTIEIEKQAAEKFMEANSSIFFAQLMFLQDDQFIAHIENHIIKRGFSASYAIKLACQHYISQFNNDERSDIACS